MKTNPSGAELLTETELENSMGMVVMTEDEEGYEGARLDVTDEERLGFDDMTKSKLLRTEFSIDTEETCCDVDDEDKLGFDDMTKTKPSGAELFIETDEVELCVNEELDGWMRMDEYCADDDDDDEEEL